MLYCVEIDVKIPDGFDPEKLETLKAREKQVSSSYQHSGEWRHLWRVAGRFANLSIFDVESHARLHEILSSLPLFPFMTVRIVPLIRHPSAIAGLAD